MMPTWYICTNCNERAWYQTEHECKVVSKKAEQKDWTGGTTDEPLAWINKEEDKRPELTCQSKWFIDMLLKERVDKILKECREARGE